MSGNLYAQTKPSVANQLVNDQSTIMLAVNGIFRPDQLEQLRAYKKQQATKAQYSFKNKRRDQQDLYKLMMSPQSDSKAFEKTLAKLSADQADILQMRFNLVQKVYQIADSEQKPLVAQQFEKILHAKGSAAACSLPSNK